MDNNENCFEISADTKKVTAMLVIFQALTFFMFILFMNASSTGDAIITGVCLVIGNTITFATLILTIYALIVDMNMMKNL